MVEREHNEENRLPEGAFRQLRVGLESSILTAPVILSNRELQEGNSAIVYISLRMGLPDLVGDPRTSEGKERLEDVYAMVDYTNAYNGVVDEKYGITRILDEQPNHPYRDHLEAAIKGIGVNWQKKKDKMFATFEKHGRLEEAMTISRVFESDLYQHVVEGNRDIASFSSGAVLRHRELDNGIFTIACASALYGVEEFSDQYSNLEEGLESRYEWLLNDSDPEDPVKHWVKMLHKSNVPVSLFDDVQGREEDERLGLITYPIYLSKVKALNEQQIQQVAKFMMESYFKQAEQLGMASFLRRTISFAARISQYPQKMKDKWKQEDLTVEELEAGGVVYLREKLYAKGMI